MMTIDDISDREKALALKGKIVSSNSMFIYVFETLEAARKMAPKLYDYSGASYPRTVSSATITTMVRKMVWYTNVNDPLLVLDVRKFTGGRGSRRNFLKVLHGNRIGWLIYEKNLDLVPVK